MEMKPIKEKYIKNDYNINTILGQQGLHTGGRQTCFYNLLTPRSG